jgi:hypothetical protein
MKSCLLFILLLSFTQYTFSQQSDFIVLKKRNNRTVKTYYPGAFISASTYNGFNINGFIKDIRNDSLIILQEERRLMATDFGSVVDTFSYTIGIDYREIERFNYTSQYTWGRKRGFTQIVLPKLMMIGGAGFIALELINTAYRNDSLTDSKKLLSLGIAAGVAAAGYTISRLQNRNNKAGKKYKVVYVKKEELKSMKTTPNP